LAIPWVEFYRPKHLKDIVGNQKAAEKLEAWLRLWPTGEKKAALLVGPPGVGKTTAVYALAHERGFEVIEMNASDQRNRNQIQNIAGMTATHQMLSSHKQNRLLLLDEVDGVFGKEDLGGIGAIIQVIRTTKIPVVMTANDRWSQKLSSLRNLKIKSKKAVEIIEFRRLEAPDIEEVLRRITYDQDLDLPLEIVKDLAAFSGGDLRAAINELESINPVKSGKSSGELEIFRRDQTKDIYNVLNVLFQAKTIKSAADTLRGLDLDFDMAFQWIYENAYLQAATTLELHHMYEELARADVFRARINATQNWKLLPHFINHMTAGVALSKKSQYRRVRSQFPSFLIDRSRARKKRTLRTAIYSKVGKKAHLSIHQSIQDYGFLLQTLFENDPEAAAKTAIWLGLADEEVKFLAAQVGKSVRAINTAIRKIKPAYNIQLQERNRQQLKYTPLFSHSDGAQRQLAILEPQKEKPEEPIKPDENESKEPKEEEKKFRTLDAFFGTKKEKKSG